MSGSIICSPQPRTFSFTYPSKALQESLRKHLRKWGTLYPFLCHGVEGRHRYFKADIHLSCGSQWDRRGTKVGFRHVLKLDRIGWALRSLKEPPAPRYRMRRLRELSDMRKDIVRQISRCAHCDFARHSNQSGWGARGGSVSIMVSKFKIYVP